MQILINKEVAEASRGTPLAEAQVAATKTAVPYLRNSAVKFFFYYIKVCKSLGKFICTFASHRQRVSVAATCAFAIGVPRLDSLHDDQFYGKLLLKISVGFHDKK